MPNLMEGLLEQLNRCREVLKEYENIPEGALGAAMIRQDIVTAERAIGSGDVVEILQAYTVLKDIK